MNANFPRLIDALGEPLRREAKPESSHRLGGSCAAAHPGHLQGALLCSMA